MCGIAGYIGPRNAIEVVYDQLKRLEYRGYDSAGIAFLDGGDIRIIKKAGKLSELRNALPNGSFTANLAIGHSRWATHGGPTDENAHPHYDQFDQIAIIHNGIIENYLDLKEALSSRGSVFVSDTDTEVAAHVIGQEYAEGVTLEEAVRRAIKQLRGAYSLVVVSKREPNKIVAVRHASPLVLGFGDGENMLASDIPALLPYTRSVYVMEDHQLAVLTQQGVSITDFDGKAAEYSAMHVDWDAESAEKGGYAHFMLKEIHDQPQVVRQCLAGRIDGNEIRLDHVFGDNVWIDIDRVSIIACGTSYHAGLMAKHMFETLLRLPTDVFYSSEFRYGDPVLSPKSLAILVSQSGETADTLAALKLLQDRRVRTLGIVNVIGSSIARQCDRTIVTQAGPEISVASTKAYTAQVLCMALLCLHIAQVREMPGVRVEQFVRELKSLDSLIEQIFEQEAKIFSIAEKIKAAKLMFFLGRGTDALVALEGALKMKEVAYIATQESPAGEMKHGPLALIEPGVVAVVGATDASTREKLASNIKEIQARGGTVVAITTDDDTLMARTADETLVVPKTHQPILNALLSIVPLQLLAYETARLNGCEIDQPRNLAKSVTVE